LKKQFQHVSDIEQPIFLEVENLDQFVDIGTNIMELRKGKIFQRLYLRAHGNEELLHFGNGTNGLLSIDKLFNEGHDIVPLLYDMTTNESLIILTGCMTGVEKGLAKNYLFYSVE
jgi:hypothetical protein